MERVISVVVRWPVLRVGLRAAYDTPDEISSSHLGNSVASLPFDTDGRFGIYDDVLHQLNITKLHERSRMTRSMRAHLPVQWLEQSFQHIHPVAQ